MYPDLNPIALSLGPIQVRWYGIMYVIGFISAWALGAWRASKPNSGWTSEQVSDLIFYCVIGVIVGGRLGYILFYDAAALINDPLYVLRIWEPGMSFHGGLVGVILSFWWFAYKNKKTLAQVGDFMAPLVPLGLGAGRIGNFINGELWGLPTNLPWGMVFPHVDNLPRHPSQLYEFILEGVLLFIILWTFSSKPRPEKAVSGVFLVCYGVMRFFVEFVRQPDSQMGYLAFGWLTMGQALSIPMIAFGGWWLWLAYGKKFTNQEGSI